MKCLFSFRTRQVWAFKIKMKHMRKFQLSAMEMANNKNKPLEIYQERVTARLLEQTGREPKGVLGSHWRGDSPEERINHSSRPTADQHASNSAAARNHEGRRGEGHTSMGDHSVASNKINDTFQRNEI
jgi:hypothetical protein